MSGEQLEFGLEEATGLLEHVAVFQTDHGFEPTCMNYRPTKYCPGEPGKVEVLRRRLENSQPLWHPDDKKGERRTDYAELIGMEFLPE